MSLNGMLNQMDDARPDEELPGSESSDEELGVDEWPDSEEDEEENIAIAASNNSEKLATTQSTNEGSNTANNTPKSNKRGAAKRGPGWGSWELRALVKETLNVDPYTCEKGEKDAKWMEVSDKLKEAKSYRSGKACKTRVGEVIKKHRADQARSLMLTGKSNQ